ncbi:YkvA family protein [Chroococcidiopsis sp. CCMEE 29]|uniref:YkvA family protein n=1 Tax=Chroococcidiopsis sp. CCMEE 29 TaxID=155894 RepID=UPI0020211F2E|nr:YkvA family protein [Chroococcidiopsis sp. CCMEE 29]
MLNWKKQVRQLKKQTYVIYLACKDSRVPWYARALAALIVAYALSPIDLIPDVIPVIGYLDDLILVPLGIILVMRMIPPEVLGECREKAEATMSQTLPKSRSAAVVVIVIWLLLGILAVVWIGRIL